MKQASGWAGFFFQGVICDFVILQFADSELGDA